MFGFFSGAENKEGEASGNSEERRVTRAYREQNQLTLQIPPSLARGRRTPSPRAPGNAHNANSSIIFAYDSTNLSQAARQRGEEAEAESQFTDNAEFEQFVHNVSSTTETMATQLTDEEIRSSAATALNAATTATGALETATNLIASLTLQQQQLQTIIQQQQQQLQQQTQVKSRKPELPDFDSKNIEVWIKRVTAAYDRANITLPKDKFAYLETKFHVGQNPKIDEFLYGAATDATWNAFLTYLRSEYGRTVRQEAQFLRGQFSRDGRRPTQMLAHLKDKVKRVTIDDLFKEIVISSLPGDVQRMVVERVQDMTSEQAAAIADNYFDQEGKVIHATNPTVHHLDSAPSFTPVFQSEAQGDAESDADINAVHGKKGNFRPRNRNHAPFYANSGAKPKNRGPYNNASAPSSGASFNHSSNSSSKPTTKTLLCRNHEKFGDATYNCSPECSRWPEMQRRQGNGRAGNRM